MDIDKELKIIDECRRIIRNEGIKVEESYNEINKNSNSIKRSLERIHKDKIQSDSDDVRCSVCSHYRLKTPQEVEYGLCVHHLRPKLEEERLVKEEEDRIKAVEDAKKFCKHCDEEYEDEMDILDIDIHKHNTDGFCSGKCSKLSKGFVQYDCGDGCGKGWIVEGRPESFVCSKCGWKFGDGIKAKGMRV